MADDIQNIDAIVDHLIVKPASVEPAKAEESASKEEPKALEVPIAVKKEEPREKPTEEPGPDEGGDETPIEEPDDDQVDIDAIELDVLVDGEARKVPIAELKKRFSFEAAVDKRLEDVSKGRQYIQQQANELNKVLAQSAARLQALDGVLQQAGGDEPNWDELRIKDPTKYLFERERMREISDRRNRIHYEQTKIAEQQADLERAALFEYGREEYAKLVRVDPKFGDPVEGPKAKTKLYEAGRSFGFTAEEVDSVRDHRAILALDFASKWLDHVAKQKNATTVAKIAPRPLLAPGVKPQPSKARTTEQKNMAALRAKARETGHVDDVAATFLTKVQRTR